MYGIECSSIAEQAMRIVKDNGYEDKVTIVKGKVGACACMVHECAGLRVHHQRSYACMHSRIMATSTGRDTIIEGKVAACACVVVCT